MKKYITVMGNSVMCDWKNKKKVLGKCVRQFRLEEETGWLIETM